MTAAGRATSTSVGWESGTVGPDIAIASWSTTWNYGAGWEGELLAAYGLDADPDRTRYYRLLWDLTD